MSDTLHEQRDIAMPYTYARTAWDYYAPYTTDSLLQDGGKTLYVLASTYSHYGVYLYRITLNRPSPSIAPRRNTVRSQPLSPKNTIVISPKWVIQPSRCRVSLMRTT